MPKLREAMGDLLGEVNEKGVTALQTLEREIMMTMMLVKLAFEDMGRIPEAELRNLRSARREINDHMELLRRMKETNAEFYYGSKYAVRLDQVHDFLKVVMQIILTEVRDPQVLRKIAGKIDQLSRTNFKTDVAKVAHTIEVENVKESSTDGVGVDRPVAVGDDSGHPASGGAHSDAGLPVSPESPGDENKGFGSTSEQG